MKGKDTTWAERISAHRTLPASLQAIFDVLTDPDGHVAIDSSGMLQGPGPDGGRGG